MGPIVNTHGSSFIIIIKWRRVVLSVHESFVFIFVRQHNMLYKYRAIGYVCDADYLFISIAHCYYALLILIVTRMHSCNREARTHKVSRTFAIMFPGLRNNRPSGIIHALDESLAVRIEDAKIESWRMKLGRIIGKGTLDMYDELSNMCKLYVHVCGVMSVARELTVATVCDRPPYYADRGQRSTT